MAEIPRLAEGRNIVIPDYSGRQFTGEELARGAHRDFTTAHGSDWEQGGVIQLDFLKRKGLRPEHRFIDVGCGALRAGRHLIDYLDPGNYYGIDANADVLQAGYDRELTDAQRERLPVQNLRVNDRFNADFGVQFDAGIAQSVFTHVSLNHMRLCLFRLARVIRPDGVFYASFFEEPESRPIDDCFQRVANGRGYFYEKNLYWYHRSDLKWLASTGPWRFGYEAGYGNVSNQKMVSYTRLDDAELTHQAAERADRAARAATAAEAARVANAVSNARAAHVNAAIRAGGGRAILLRARRKVSRVISPY